MSKLWVIAPVYNEEKSLDSFVREWIPVLRAVTGGDFTFCLLNDGSRDGSLHVLKSLSEAYPEILVVDKANTGHGATCLLGYQMAVEAKADWIFQIDSDGQCDPVHFEAFWASRTDGHVHYGCRRGREDGWHRRLISKVLACILFLLCFRWVRDPNVPYRLMRRDFLQPALQRIPSGFRLVQVLLARMHDENPGIRWHPIRFRRRPGRKDSLNAPFFLREAVFFVRDYASWAWRDGNPGVTERINGIGRVLLSLFAAYFIIVFLVLAFVRIPALIEYDWIEGVHMQQVHRILEGLPLYPPPSVSYTPVIYAPLYSHVSAAVSLFAGESYQSLRLVSLVSTLGILVLIGMLVRKMGGSIQAAWVAAGLYAGMYKVVGFYFDAARLDSLFIFFTMAAVYGMRSVSDRSWPASICTALAATCAVLTKQTALLPVLAVCLWGFIVPGRRTRITALLCLGFISVSQLSALIMTDGWFFYYVYKVPSAHPILMENVNYFIRKELFQRLWLGFVLSSPVVFILFRKDDGKREAFFFLVFFLAMVAAGLAPRFKVGGYVNNLMPVAAALAVGCGLLLGHAHYMKRSVAALVVLVLLFWGYQMTYRTAKALPSPEVLEQTRIELRLFQRIEAPVFAPCHAYLPVLAGKNGSAFWGAIFDVWLTPGVQSRQLREAFSRALEERQFKTIVLKDRFFKQEAFPYGLLKEHYREHDLAGILSGTEAGAAGVRLYVPRQD